MISIAIECFCYFVFSTIHGLLRLLTVLDLLAVPWRLLQGFDDEGGGGGHDRDGGDTVLDAQLDSDLQTLPVSGRLGDIISDLLGRLQLRGRVFRGYVSVPGQQMIRVSHSPDPMDRSWGPGRKWLRPLRRRTSCTLQGKGRERRVSIDTHTWDTSNFGGAFLRLPRTELDLIGIELGRHGDCVVVCTVSSCKENADCE